MSLQILLQNKKLCVVNKASGTLSIPARTGESDPRLVVGIELQKQLGIQIFPVHRLDFEVSGVLIFALDADTHKILNHAFENNLVKKTYQAFTSRTLDAKDFPLNEAMEWKSKIVRGKKRSFFAPHGKDSVTHARLLKSTPESPEWELKPITGRSHQLRVELASRGYPIVGDKLYGSPLDFMDNAIALRCVEIDLNAVPGHLGTVFSCEKISKSQLKLLI